jgi:hypothetical protein
MIPLKCPNCGSSQFLLSATAALTYDGIDVHPEIRNDPCEGQPMADSHLLCEVCEWEGEARACRGWHADNNNNNNTLKG